MIALFQQNVAWNSENLIIFTWPYWKWKVLELEHIDFLKCLRGFNSVFDHCHLNSWPFTQIFCNFYWYYYLLNLLQILLWFITLLYVFDNLIFDIRNKRLGTFSILTRKRFVFIMRTVWFKALIYIWLNEHYLRCKHNFMNEVKSTNNPWLPIVTIMSLCTNVPRYLHSRCFTSVVSGHNDRWWVLHLVF